MEPHDTSDTSMQDAELNDTAVEVLLKACRIAYDYVGPAAALEAIEFAAVHGVPSPIWAIDELKIALLTKSRASPFRRLRSFISDFDRWEKVTINDGMDTEEEKILAAMKLLADEKKAIDYESVRKSYFKVRKMLRDSEDCQIMFWLFERIRQRYLG